MEKEKNDLCKWLHCQKTINDDLERDAVKMKSTLFGKAVSMWKELRQTKKKLVVLENRIREVTSEQDQVIAKRDQAITEHDQMKEGLEYVQEQMRDISDFGHLAMEGLPKDFAHVLAEWIENNSKKVAEKREKWKKQGPRM